MQKVQPPSRKNFESSESPRYLLIANSPVSPPPRLPNHQSKKPQLQSSFRFSLSKDSPFLFSAPTEQNGNSQPQKSPYNILKDNQEFRIGEDPKARSRYLIKARLPPVEVYKYAAFLLFNQRKIGSCLTNETRVFERPEVVRREASSYKDAYQRLQQRNFNAFHRKNGFFETK
jgi:hypothetical protein